MNTGKIKSQIFVNYLELFCFPNVLQFFLRIYWSILLQQQILKGIKRFLGHSELFGRNKTILNEHSSSIRELRQSFEAYESLILLKFFF